jgi:prophage antirepressor-like protein
MYNVYLVNKRAVMNRVLRAIEELGLDRKVVASRCGDHGKGYLSTLLYEADAKPNSEIKRETVEVLAKALGVSVGWLLTERGPMVPEPPDPQMPLLLEEGVGGEALAEETVGSEEGIAGDSGVVQAEAEAEAPSMTEIGSVLTEIVMPDPIGPVAARIEAVLKADGLSPRAASERLGFSTTYIGSLIYRGSRTPDGVILPETVRCVARGLAVEYRWLAVGEGAMRPWMRPAIVGVATVVETEEVVAGEIEAGTATGATEEAAGAAPGDEPADAVEIAATAAGAPASPNPDPSPPTFAEVIGRLGAALAARGLSQGEMVTQARNKGDRRQIRFFLRDACERPGEPIGAKHAPTVRKMAGILRVKSSWLLDGIGPLPEGVVEGGRKEAMPEDAKATSFAVVVGRIQQAETILGVKIADLAGRLVYRAERRAVRKFLEEAELHPQAVAWQRTVAILAKMLTCREGWLWSGAGEHGIIVAQKGTAAVEAAAADQGVPEAGAEVVETQAEVQAPEPVESKAAPESEGTWAGIVVQPFQFDEHEIATIILPDGRPCWLVPQVETVLGYGRGNLATVLRSWSDELIPGHDHEVVTGKLLAGMRKELNEFYSFSSHAGGITVLFESGLNIVCLKTEKPAGKRLRRKLADDVLPSIRRTGAFMTPAAAAALVPLSEARVVEIVDARLAPLVEIVRSGQQATAEKLDGLTTLAICTGDLLGDALKRLDNLGELPGAIDRTTRLLEDTRERLDRLEKLPIATDRTTQLLADTMARLDDLEGRRSATGAGPGPAAPVVSDAPGVPSVAPSASAQLPSPASRVLQGTDDGGGAEIAPALAAPSPRRARPNGRSRYHLVKGSTVLRRMGDLLKYLGLNEAQLGTQLGRGEGYIGNFLSAVRRGSRQSVRPSTLERIARGAGCSPRWLCTGRGGIKVFPKSDSAE